MERARNTLFFVAFSLLLAPRAMVCQTTPPTVNYISPTGLQQGATGTFLVEGTGLTGATAIVFSEPGLKGTVLEVGEVPESRLALETKVAVVAKPYFQDPVKMQAKVEIAAEKWVATGTHQFRIIASDGSSTPGNLMVGSFPEIEEREPNDEAAHAQQVALPTTVNGVILKAGDEDQFRFRATSGKDVVLLVNGPDVGSSLNPVIDLFDSEGRQVASNSREHDRLTLGYRAPASGWYTVRVSDYLKGGSLRHFYRLTLGEFPFLKGRYPLGLQAGTARQFQIWGLNLGDTVAAVPEPFGLMAGKTLDVGAISATTRNGDTANLLPVAIGPYKEVEEAGSNHSVQSAQELGFPVTVNGRILLDSSGHALPDFYRFTAKKGQKLILETTANRLGSPLDSVVEVLDANRNLVPRLTARPVWKTQITLFDRESKSPGLRLAQTTDLELHDYMVAGNDLMRVVKLTNGPDEDVIFENFGGQRLGMEDTTPEAHALDDFIYKVQLHPPGAQFPPNGMPVFRFYMHNDDGGPGYGKDSRVTFTAPNDGVYYAKVADVRNQGGENFAYRFTIREPVADFLITALPTNPNIPDGAKVPIEVVALRKEGFEGQIHVQFDSLPEGFTGTSGDIPAGEASVTLLLSHRSGMKLPGGWTRYRIVGEAAIGKETVRRVANEGDMLRVVSLMPKPDIKVYVKDEKIRINPKGEAQMTLAVERFNGFKGRVLFRIQDLPFGVRPIDVGLNGVMIAENETERTFTLECRPFVKPVIRQIYAVGVVEALVPTEHSSRPVTLEVGGTGN